MNSKIPVSVQILTLNSEKTLGKALESVKNFDDIVVLDGNSTDGTRDLALSFGARVYPQTERTERNIRITDYSEVRNKGLALARHPWILYIDSDEYLSPESAEEIRAISENPDSVVGVYQLPRKYILDGELIERASVYPNYQNRFFHTDAVTGFVKPVHENLKRKPNVSLLKLQYPEYVPLDTLADAKTKTNTYLSIQQQALRNLSLWRLLKAVRSNTKKTVVSVIKYVATFLHGRGKRLPFGYEYINMTYHARLLGRLFVNYYRKFI